jgi:glycosyltransferase involved in cell wall biosynthesis
MVAAAPAGRKLRVLTLVDALAAAGGAERLAIQLALKLDPARFDRFVCATRYWKRAAFLDELREAGVPVVQLERRSKLDLLVWRRLLALLRDERIDVVHAHKFGSNFWGALLGPLAGVPVVIAHEHSWSFEGQLLRRLIDRHVIARRATAIVAVSSEDRRRMIEIEHIPAGMIHTIPNGIPPLPSRQGDVRAELGIPATAPVIGTVSVIRHEKALEVFVDAAGLLREDFPGLRALIAADGPAEARTALEARIAERGLEDVVLLLGRRPDVPDVVAAFDLAVICSDFEGCPLSVIEYMAAGKAVVATRVGGLPALVEEDVSGLLVPPRNAEALAGAVGRLLRDPERRARMGEAGRERQQREYDETVMLRRFEELYEQLFAQTAAPTGR